jgi:hypothetical protein
VQQALDLATFAAARSHLADITFQDNVEHVMAALRRVAPHSPVILVGASVGGLTLTGVGNTAPELVSRLVYLIAFGCVELPLRAPTSGSAPQSTTACSPTSPSRWCSPMRRSTLAPGHHPPNLHPGHPRPGATAATIRWDD